MYFVENLTQVIFLKFLYAHPAFSRENMSIWISRCGGCMDGVAVREVNSSRTCHTQSMVSRDNSEFVLTSVFIRPLCV